MLKLGDNQLGGLEADDEAAGPIHAGIRQLPQSTAETLASAMNAGTPSMSPAQSVPSKESSEYVDCGQQGLTCDSSAYDDGILYPAVVQRGHMVATSLSSGQQPQLRQSARLLAAKRPRHWNKIIDSPATVPSTQISSGQQPQLRQSARLLAAKRTRHGDETDSPATVPSTQISSGQQHQLRQSARLLAAKRTPRGDETDSPATAPPTQIIEESGDAKMAPRIITVTYFQSPEQHHGSMDARQPQTLRKSQRLSAQRTACQWKTGSSPSFTLPPTQASLEEQNIPVGALSPVSAFQSPEQRLGSMDAITSTSNGQPQTLRKSPRLSAQRTACQQKMGSSALTSNSIEEQNFR